MHSNEQERIKKLVAQIPTLTDGQLYWIDRVVTIFNCPHKFEISSSDLLDQTTLINFGDALRIHHCFSAEPFSKDKFEYVLERTLNMSGHEAHLAPKGNKGHDITIDGVAVSLKTQADKDIRVNTIWISKFMELGKGNWGDNPSDLYALRDVFIQHLNGYKRIFTLRALARAPEWHYELVEIPKELLYAAINGTIEMKLKSKQYPKPGYCHVSLDNGVANYQLYFDGGGERKLQIKNLPKSHCKVHANWKFQVPEEY